MENTTVDIDSGIRIVKLRNNRGRIMFLVEYLEGTEIIVVKVREVTNLDVPFDVVRTEYYVSQKENAIANFKQLVDDYRALIDALDQQVIDPYEVFEHAVNYHEIDPDRCFNCAFSKYESPSCIAESEEPCENVLVCMQRHNIRQYYDIDREFSHGGTYQQTSPVPVCENAICNNYKRECNLNNMNMKCGIRGGLDLRCLKRDHDLIDLIKTMQENRLVEFEDEIYIKNGSMNPKFRSNVLSVVTDLSAAPELCACIEHAVDVKIESIQISSIAGGDESRDDNHNGIPDEDEITYSFGGLGA